MQFNTYLPTVIGASATAPPLVGKGSKKSGGSKGSSKGSTTATVGNKQSGNKNGTTTKKVN